MIIRFLFVSLIIATSVFASDDYSELRTRADKYWLQIQRIGAKEYGGLNLEVTVHTAYNFESSETSSSGKGLGLGLSMPIYSKKDKLANRAAVREFLEHGSDLIMKFRESIAHGEITSEECRLTETLMPEQGVESARAYFDCKRRQASMKLVVEQRERDIKSLLDPYLKRVNETDIIKTGGQ